MTQPHRFPFGAQVLSPDLTSFRLWAPDVETVALVIEGRGPTPMTAGRDGWFETVVSCRPGAYYRFRLPDGLDVPDPASRQQVGGPHGPSVVVDPDAYVWKHPEWNGRPWHEAVIYELHAGLCGGFTGVMKKLPELVELGVTAVELMPIAQFPGERNWGYDGVLPFAPAEAYGPPDDLKLLIDTAHGLGLMVLLDVVYNHFGPDGNYLHAYAQKFFREDRKTGWGAAIDTRRSAVRDFFIENARYWLSEYRFDGLRMDAVHAIGDDDYLVELASSVRDSLPAERIVHLVVENEHNGAVLLERTTAFTQRERKPQPAFDAQWNDDGHHALHVLLTGEREGYYEDYAEDTAAKLARCLSEGFIYQGEHSPHCDRKRGEPSAHVRSTAFVLFMQNHDHIGNRAFGERLLTLCDEDAFRAATALVLLSPQIPLLFMGEEDGARDPFLFFTDHNEELAQQVRDGRGKEFAKFAAFAGAKKLADPNDRSTFEVSTPKTHADSADWRAFYRKLLALRATHIVPTLEGARDFEGSAMGRAAVRVGWRSAAGDTLWLYCNLDAEAVELGGPLDGRLVYTTDDAAEAALFKGLLAGRSTLLLMQSNKATTR